MCANDVAGIVSMTTEEVLTELRGLISSAAKAAELGLCPSNRVMALRIAAEAVRTRKQIEQELKQRKPETPLIEKLEDLDLTLREMIETLRKHEEEE